MGFSFNNINFLIITGLLTVTATLAQQYSAGIPILSQTQEHNPDGSFQYSFSTGNGISTQEKGYLKNAGNPKTEAQVAEGSYQYTAPDGTPVAIRYVSDENGFRAEGDAIPTPPPIPPAIQRALDLIARQPQQPQQFRG
uniref:Uncharacterized protein n=1 Tax=Clastoptera arizonana TaxID=38151 RepID=A0A1B6DTM8_9HEMI